MRRVAQASCWVRTPGSQFQKLRLLLVLPCSSSGLSSGPVARARGLASASDTGSQQWKRAFCSVLPPSWIFSALLRTAGHCRELSHPAFYRVFAMRPALLLASAGRSLRPLGLVKGMLLAKWSSSGVLQQHSTMPCPHPTPLSSASILASLPTLQPRPQNDRQAVGRQPMKSGWTSHDEGWPVLQGHTWVPRHRPYSQLRNSCAGTEAPKGQAARGSAGSSILRHATVDLRRSSARRRSPLAVAIGHLLGT